jgi:hypothetical protein
MFDVQAAIIRPSCRRPYIAWIRAAIQGAGQLRQDDRIFYGWDLSEIEKAWDLDFDPDFDFEKPFCCDRPGICTLKTRRT